MDIKKTLCPGGWISSRHAVLYSRFQGRTPYQSQASRYAPLTSLLLVGKDITVTGIKDGHGGAAEELTTSGTKLNLSRKKSKHEYRHPPKSTTRLLLWADRKDPKGPFGHNYEQNVRDCIHSKNCIVVKGEKCQDLRWCRCSGGLGSWTSSSSCLSCQRRPSSPISGLRIWHVIRMRG